MDLSIIIINWNSCDYVRACLSSIFANPPRFLFEVIVLDSASYDGCKEMIERQFPQVKYVQCEENVGFGRANNLAVQSSTGHCLLFLNPDTEVIGTAVEVLFDHQRGLTRAGAVGCTLLNSDRTLQTSCIQSFPTVLNQLLDSEFLRKRFPSSPLWGMGPLYSGQTTPAEVEVISGACIMMQREVFDRIGQFTPDYFMYTEDIDLCFKARRTGYINYYVPGPAVVHHGNGSVSRAQTNFAVVMGVESLWRFLKKYRGTLYALLYRNGIVLAAVGRLLLLSSRRLFPVSSDSSKPDSAFAKWSAILRWGTGLERWAGKYR